MSNIGKYKFQMFLRCKQFRLIIRVHLGGRSSVSTNQFVCLIGDNVNNKLQLVFNRDKLVIQFGVNFLKSNLLRFSLVRRRFQIQ